MGSAGEVELAGFVLEGVTRRDDGGEGLSLAVGAGGAYGLEELLV